MIFIEHQTLQQQNYFFTICICVICFAHVFSYHNGKIPSKYKKLAKRFIELLVEVILLTIAQVSVNYLMRPL